MIHREIKLPKNQTLFLFGARGTGKSTLLKEIYPSHSIVYIDLLDPNLEDRFNKNPMELEYLVNATNNKTKYIIIDEVQKCPKLLEVVHKQINATNKSFILTGSSARKLKRGAANLLAGRAFVYHLYPLTYSELENQFDLQGALEWGTLPGLLKIKSKLKKAEFLRSYGFTYLKEEISAEQLIRNLNPFRNFLEIAAQSNGLILNFSKIARDVGVDTKTIQSYFEILEDTLLGFYLLPFHESIRKRQNQNPKFYFIDTGLKRALERTLNVPLNPKTFAYGNTFEHFIIVELHKINAYKKKDWKFSYLRTKDGVEIDCIIERPGKKRALIEIKSKNDVTEDDIRNLIAIKKDIKNSQAFLFSQDPIAKKIKAVDCLPWREGFKKIL